MNSTIPRTIEEPSLDTDKVGTLEPPSPDWLGAQELNVTNVAAARSGRPNEPLGSKPHVAFRTI